MSQPSATCGNPRDPKDHDPVLTLICLGVCAIVWTLAFLAVNLDGLASAGLN